MLSLILKYAYEMLCKASIAIHTSNIVSSQKKVLLPFFRENTHWPRKTVQSQRRNKSWLLKCAKQQISPGA